MGFEEEVKKMERTAMMFLVLFVGLGIGAIAFLLWVVKVLFFT